SFAPFKNGSLRQNKGLRYGMPMMLLLIIGGCFGLKIDQSLKKMSNKFPLIAETKRQHKLNEKRFPLNIYVFIHENCLGQDRF
uniref:Uncharacterized protein n=1 Tax=Leptobrachium leishanense TaxID=445787 RepID=A0A8C5QPC8_9ANUR